MRKTVVPLLKNSLFALFLLLVSPLFFSSVATAQEVAACNCNTVLAPFFNITLTKMDGGSSCCYSFGITGLKNNCSSAITNIQYQLQNAPPCLNQAFRVYRAGSLEPIGPGTINPANQPLLPYLASPIAAGQTVAGQYYTMCPVIPGGIICPCSINFTVNINITFADGTTCNINRTASILSYDNTCCTIGVNEEVTLESKLTLSPNPINSEITATYNQTLDGKRFSIQLFDLKGNIVGSKENIINSGNTFSITTEKLSVGTYLFVLKSEQGELLGSKRFTISR